MMPPSNLLTKGGSSYGMIGTYNEPKNLILQINVILIKPFKDSLSSISKCDAYIITISIFSW